MGRCWFLISVGCNAQTKIIPTIFWLETEYLERVCVANRSICDSVQKSGKGHKPPKLKQTLDGWFLGIRRGNF
jgi:hypothetical protein